MLGKHPATQNWNESGNRKWTDDNEAGNKASFCGNAQLLNQ